MATKRHRKNTIQPLRAPKPKLQLATDCWLQIQKYLSLPEKMWMRRICKQWPVLKLTTLETVLVHLLTTIVSTFNGNPRFSYHPFAGLTFNPSPTTCAYSLKIMEKDERMFLMRHIESTNTWKFVCGFAKGEKYCVAIPKMSSFANVTDACAWMKHCVLHESMNVSIFAAACPLVLACFN